MMTGQNQTVPTSFKACLGLIAVVFATAAALLLILSTSAATVTGSTPFLSIALVEGVNTGLLGPGQERWFRLRLDQPAPGGSVEQALTLVYTPGNDSQSQVTMQLFEEQRLQLFYTGVTSQMANLGAGQTVTHDNNPETGELFWSGWLPGEASYYIQLSNSTAAPIDYWLMTGDIRGLPLGATAALPATPPVAPTPAIASGNGPGQAIILNIGQNQGQLKPGQEIWYRFTLTDADGEYFDEAALTMVVIPNSSDQIGGVEFDLFTSREVENWLAGHVGQPNNIGAGSLVRRDSNPLTGERFWTGWLIDGELYYIRVRNGADGPVDYWLFTGDVYNPRLGSETQ
jgi:hypothetical protein